VAHRKSWHVEAPAAVYPHVLRAKSLPNGEEKLANDKHARTETDKVVCYKQDIYIKRTPTFSFYI
jgi:hypothetical protein